MVLKLQILIIQKYSGIRKKLTLIFLKVKNSTTKNIDAKNSNISAALHVIILNNLIVFMNDCVFMS